MRQEEWVLRHPRVSPVRVGASATRHGPRQPTRQPCACPSPLSNRHPLRTNHYHAALELRYLSNAKYLLLELSQLAAVHVNQLCGVVADEVPWSSSWSPSDQIGQDTKLAKGDCQSSEISRCARFDPFRQQCNEPHSQMEPLLVDDAECRTGALPQAPAGGPQRSGGQ